MSEVTSIPIYPRIMVMVKNQSSILTTDLINVWSPFSMFSRFSARFSTDISSFITIRHTARRSAT